MSIYVTLITVFYVSCIGYLCIFVESRASNEIVIGGLGNKGESALFLNWAPTFETYLTERLGQQLNVTFTLRYLDFDTTFSAVENREIDFVFTNPTLFACVERMYGASALVTLLNFRKGYELDRYYGVFITRNDSAINNLTGIVDNVVEAVSPSGLGACQLQWNELILHGLDFLNQPKQIIFSNSQKKIVHDVLSGVADIGMVRTDLLETMADDGEINITDLRILEDVSADVNPEFPFRFSTHLASPEWPVGTFPWTDLAIAEAVAMALVSLNRTHYAAVAGSYSKFIPPLSYFQIHQLQERLGFVNEGRCVSGTSSFYESIICPEGQVKKHPLLVERGCEQAGMSCPVSDDEKEYNCICRPCIEVPPEELTLHPYRRISPLHGETMLEETNCTKMEFCGHAEQRDLIEFHVDDEWFDFRMDLGKPFIEEVHYRVDFGEWQKAEVLDSPPGDRHNDNQEAFSVQDMQALIQEDHDEHHDEDHDEHHDEDHDEDHEDHDEDHDHDHDEHHDEDHDEHHDEDHDEHHDEDHDEDHEDHDEDHDHDHDEHHDEDYDEHHDEDHDEDHDHDHQDQDQVIHDHIQSHNKFFAFNISADLKGIAIVEIELCKIFHVGDTIEHEEEIQCQQIEQSPFLIQVNKVTCLYPHQEPNEDGVCSCIGGYAFNHGECVEESESVKRFIDEEYGIPVLVAIGLGFLAIVAGLVVDVFRKAEESWLIDRKLIEYDDPAEVLGRGTFGMVILGYYRNTEVAVKRVLPKTTKKKNVLSKAIRKSFETENADSSFCFRDEDSRKVSAIHLSLDSPKPQPKPSVQTDDIHDASVIVNKNRNIVEVQGKSSIVDIISTRRTSLESVKTAPLTTPEEDNFASIKARRRSSFTSARAAEWEVDMTDASKTLDAMHGDHKNSVRSDVSYHLDESADTIKDDMMDSDITDAIADTDEKHGDHNNSVHFGISDHVEKAADVNNDDVKKADDDMSYVLNVDGIEEDDDEENAENRYLSRVLTKIASRVHRLSIVPENVPKRSLARRYSIEKIWFRTLSRAKANDMQFVKREGTASTSGMSSGSKMVSLFSKIFLCHSNLGHQRRMNRDFLEEMRSLVYLRHPNIVTVMGAVVDGKGEHLLVMERMKNGSLYDLIHNSTMQFDGELVMRVLSDIVAGMIFLHASDPPILHNDLKAGNVLVGDSFHTKIADFGLSAKRKSCGLLGTPYWMAPELLHGQPSSKDTDVYAFGVLLFELFARAEPYSDHLNMTMEEILLEVADISRSEPFRPTLPENLPCLVKDLIVSCWSTMPSLRPSFSMIQQALQNFNNQEVDDWMYNEGTNISSFRGSWRRGSVGSESSDGINSKPLERSSTMLLHDVFPPHIAKTLKAGKKVDPEQHHCVTIFFSDIVGFTDISSALPPMKVMAMLDTLYHKFDKLARKHDIFKVETIGDAYMAVANLIKEQTQHTRNIAEFSIDAIRMANSSLVCEEQPELGCVNIRVGFHSGPVVSSVVGNMNPRFCLFGDTVNTSSRMESNSLKNRIHISDTAAALLREHAPELELVPRGGIQVKGKGKMNTFWLRVPGVEWDTEVISGN